MTFKLIFVLVINCVIAILSAICVSFCESQQIYFDVSPIIADKTKLKNSYANNEQYHLLVDEYERLQECWPNLPGSTFQKILFAVTTLYGFSFWGSSLAGEISPFVLILTTIAIPAAILIAIIWLTSKKRKEYRVSLKCTQGQVGFSSFFPVFYNEMDKYTYIENEHEIKWELENINRVIYRLEERIAVLKKLQQKNHEYSTHWFILSIISAVFWLLATII